MHINFRPQVKLGMNVVLCPTRQLDLLSVAFKRSEFGIGIVLHDLVGGFTFIGRSSKF